MKNSRSNRSEGREEKHQHAGGSIGSATNAGRPPVESEKITVARDEFRFFFFFSDTLARILRDVCLPLWKMLVHATQKVIDPLRV